MALIKFLFEIEKKPRKGLLAVEWVIMGYLLLTLLLMFFMTTKIQNPEPMFWLRFNAAMLTLALWVVYRLIPCRFTILCRISLQLILLSWWYPDTYEFNKLFTNQDPLFAGYDQSMWGFQPALLFSQVCSNPIFSELMHLGYASYYPLIAVVCVFYFFKRYAEFELTTFIILASFFIYYVIFIFLPVTGPQFYFQAVGIEAIEAGNFPALGTYFSAHTEMLPSPGYSDGLFYQLVESAHEAGERPTAAFPSSHIGISTLVLMLSRRHAPQVTMFLLPFWALLCCATVYIQAHYVIDAIAGLLSAPLVLWISTWLAHKIIDIRRPLSPA